MSIKGFPTTQKLVNNQSTRNEYATLQPSDIALRQNLDVIARGYFRVGALRTAQAGTGNPLDGSGTVIFDTATPARVGDMVRFESGSAASLEIAIVDILTVNSFKMAAKIPAGFTPVATDTFYILRPVTQQFSSSGTVSVTVAPTDFIESIRRDFNISPVTSAAWVQLVASTTGNSTKITIFDAGGYAMELGTGAAAAEVRKLLVPPGGLNGMIDLNIPAGTRLSYRAVGAPNVAAGELDINLFG